MQKGTHPFLGGFNCYSILVQKSEVKQYKVMFIMIIL